MARTEQFIFLLLLVFSALCLPSIKAFSFNFSRNSNLAGIIFPTPLSFNSAASAADSNCHSHHRLAGDGDPPEYPVAGDAPPVKLDLKHHRLSSDKTKEAALFDSTQKDFLRIQTLFRRATEKKSTNNKQNQNPLPSLASALKAANLGSPAPALAGRFVATVESGVALGSGEYFIDVFIGTPPQHFSLILDTGSDLNWLQCLPCHACFEQSGPIYDPSSSSSYRNLSCTDPRCDLVSRPELSASCPAVEDHSSCPYFYWYGDHSNTTGDLATEIFTVNLTDTIGGTTSRKVESVIFGCGHWNRGLFHGAAGLLGLGRGPLSFASQLRSLYGHAFSYCLVDRNSDLSVSSKLIFGEDPSLLAHPQLNFTSFTTGKENPAETFYYLHIKGIKVGGEMLDIPMDTWDVLENGAGGTIIDSGTTLSYFSEPAYGIIRKAIEKKVTYKLFEEFPVLSPCYNVSGVEKVKMPEFSIVFSDEAVWDFPMENYFIRLEPESIMCLAILGTPKTSLSILGNYQQQNFHIMYDTKNSRLGFAPMKCAEV
ncbi:aspartyl protease family protein 2 [Dendrobium catenatum]|uniref:Aspartic proteinase nepenthesin-2 n=1 Tax=Dendrobium catenatum TaxID=906689 RepID=A0A2I0WV34_9ASPA|nr:aspartyl protease family protein 2 [Dendrobium catenatum]PKU79520.1 Aspartic proteinase nepenthesin-2 [Dendrobium catenatum]